MRRHDALARIEMALVAEVVSSGVRHDLRNQITIIRGALFFLRRKVSGTEAWTRDARVAEFFKAIEEQLDRATANVDPERLSERLFTREVAPTELAACVRLAVEQTSQSTSTESACSVRADVGRSGLVPRRPGAEGPGPKYPRTEIHGAFVRALD